MHLERNFKAAFSLVFFSAFLAAAVIGQTERTPPSFAGIAKKVQPAVVSIDAKGKAPQAVVRSTPPPATGNNGDDILDFLRRQMQQRPTHAVGSGFIVDKAGYILTNAHVIAESVRVTVTLDSGEEYDARTVGVDEQTDLAVLKIEVNHDLPFTTFADSDRVEVGDWVIAIGSPFGLSRSVTAGIISQTNRQTPGGTVFERFIQTDAAINRGNSGGPLVDLDGRVIGVNSQIATTSGDYNGVGFALPSKDADYVYRQIVQNGKVRRGFLGVYLDSVKPEFAAIYGLAQPKGAIITNVGDKTVPAVVAGLKAGDILTSINGQTVEDAGDLIARVASTTPGNTVTINFLRENGSGLEQRSVSFKVSERPVQPETEENPDRRVLTLDGEKKDVKPFGLTVAELTPSLASSYRLDGQKGVLIKEINPASFIADIKTQSGSDALSEGDLIQRVNRVSVTDTKAFDELVSKLKVGDPVVLQILTPSSRGPILKIVQFTVR